MKLKAFILIGGIFLAGCGYELPKTPENVNNSRNANAQANQTADNQSAAAGNSMNKESKPADSKAETGDGKLILSGTGEIATYPCNGREVEIEEEATANSYTLTGECKKLTVAGVSNKITVEKVGEIAAGGISNRVTYTEGIGGKSPKISKSGTSNTVESKKAEEEKKQDVNKQA